MANTQPVKNTSGLCDLGIGNSLASIPILVAGDQPSLDVMGRITVSDCPHGCLNDHWIGILSSLQEAGKVIRDSCNTLEAVTLPRNGTIGIDA